MDAHVKYKDSAGHRGDNHFYQAPMSSLEKAISQIRTNLAGDEKLYDIISDLNDYITDYPLRQIIGLDKKLEQGKRQDLIEEAILLKNKFERRIAKNQMSMSEQHIYVQVLATINTIWQLKIKPMISNGDSSQAVDEAILQNLIQPVHTAIVTYDSLINTDTVRGMLFFLTGKCHLAWEK
ncbi:hypothetical protein KFZ76_11785 [Methylovulum psychrotolerans]|uniref:ABC-three component system protein n=1 Tax=Methylovulum psychrotolerans TaxID=1704499 RepID=UPI001BFF2CC8|nr:ABC-three component system protein [Methylovulum psychrotolerans]MBT9098387.1 hypothetical protein [Methylovulum psychrotolerans]